MKEDVKQVLHVEPAKSFNSAEGSENERRWDKAKIDRKNLDPDNHYDKTRFHLNFEVGSDGKIHPLGYHDKPLEQRLQDRLNELGWHPFKEGSNNQPNMVAKFIFGGNHDRTLEMAFGQQTVNLDKSPDVDNSRLERLPEIEHWALDVHQWLAQRFGVENIVGFQVHLDEQSPHIHALVVPVGERKKNGRKFVSWSSKFGADGTEYGNTLREMHTSFYEEVGQKYGLERGDSVIGRNVKHLSKKQYLAQLEREVIQKERTLKSLTTMVSNAERTIAEKEQTIKLLQQEEAEGRISVIEARQLIKEAQDVIAEKQNLIEDKNSKISEKSRELDALTSEVSKARQVVMPYRNPKVDVFPPEITGKPGFLQSFESWRSEQNEQIAKEFWHGVNHVYNSVVTDAKKQVESIQKNMLIDYNEFYRLKADNVEQIKLISDLQDSLNTLADQMVNQPMFNLVVGVAEALLDGRELPVSGGGGGSSTDMRWDGRRPDEDEEDYKRRCLFFASRYVSRMSKSGKHISRGR